MARDHQSRVTSGQGGNQPLEGGGCAAIEIDRKTFRGGVLAKRKHEIGASDTLRPKALRTQAPDQRHAVAGNDEGVLHDLAQRGVAARADRHVHIGYANIAAGSLRRRRADGVDDPREGRRRDWRADHPAARKHASPLRDDAGRPPAIASS